MSSAAFYGRLAGKNSNAVHLYAAEALEVHRLLDMAGVPRIAGGEVMSMSQRVEESLHMLRLALSRRAPSPTGDL